MTQPAPPLPGRASSGAKVFLTIAILIHAAFIASYFTGFLNPLFVEAAEIEGQAGDFFGIYHGAQNLIRGYSIYDSQEYRNEAPLIVPYYYFYRYLPPTAYFFGLWALILPHWPAYWLWLSLNELALVLVVVSILRWQRWPANRRWLAAGLWLGFFPFYLEQFMGQFSFTMGILLWLLYRYERPPAGPAQSAAAPPAGGAPAGAGPRPWRALASGWKRYAWPADSPGPPVPLWAFTGSVALKSFSVFLVFPYLRDRMLKRVLLGGALVAALCLPYFLWRPADLIEFVRLNLHPYAPALLKGTMGFQAWLTDLMIHLPGDSDRFLFSLGPIEVMTPGKIVLALVSIVILLLALWATAGYIHRRQRRAYDVALWTTVFFLVFKTTWEYHYVMLLPGLTAVYLLTGSRWLLAAGILLALPTLYAATPLLTGAAPGAPLDQWPPWYRILHYTQKTLPTLILFIWCLARSRGPASPARESPA